MTTLANAIRDAASRLPGDEARLEAELLLAHALDRPRSWALGNATINRLLHTPQGLSLVGWNDAAHLDALAAADDTST